MHANKEFNVTTEVTYHPKRKVGKYEYKVNLEPKESTATFKDYYEDSMQSNLPPLSHVILDLKKQKNKNLESVKVIRRIEEGDEEWKYQFQFRKGYSYWEVECTYKLKKHTLTRKSNKIYNSVVVDYDINYNTIMRPSDLKSFGDNWIPIDHSNIEL